MAPLKRNGAAYDSKRIKVSFMLRKLLFYCLSVAILATFACLARQGELKMPSDALRADVAAEPDAASESVAFLTDYDEAAEKAARDNKPILLFFMTKNCKFSAAMLRNAFADVQVEKLAKEFVCVQIDMNEEKNGAICDAYNVAVSPTVQFVTAQGAPLQRLASVQSGERLAAQMQIALTSVAWRDARGEEEKALLR